MLTVIGARPSVSFGIAATAVALACTETVLMPSTFEKKPGADFVCLTLIMSFVFHLLPMVIVAPSTPPFFVANEFASAVALPGLDGSAWAPASAAASTVDWLIRCWRNQEPTSRTNATIAM